MKNILESMASDMTHRLFEADDKKESPKTVGVIDTNIGIDHALALAKQFKVYYWASPGGAFPSIQNEISGDGFPQLIKVDSQGYCEEQDFILIPDCFFGKDADNWRSKGKAVYGTSAEWGKIENDRRYGWNALKKMGVGVPDGTIVHGLEELLNLVEKDASEGNPVYMKTSKYRGSRETGKGVTSRTQALTAITQGGYGPYLSDMEILVQKQCPGLELGCDIYINGKDYIKPFLFTIERKGEGTVGVWVENNILDELIFDRIKQSLISTDYRGNISFEFFWDGKQIRVHDPTCRNPFPNSTINPHFIDNYPEDMYKIASKQDVTLQIPVKYSKYVAQVGVYTDDIETWRDIHFPKGLEDRIGFRRIVKKDGDYYFVPGDQLVATAVGAGKTPKAAIEDAINIASQIEAANTYIPARFEDDVLKVIEKLNAMKGDLKF